jgi:hypothetical protein
MKNDWYEPTKYCDPFIEWNEYKDQKEKENEIKERTKEN